MSGNRVILLIAVFVLISGCDTTSVSDHVAETVVEAYLVAGEALPEIRVSRTQDIDSDFNFAELAVSNASVVVFLRGEGSVIEGTYRYLPDPTRSGVYIFEQRRTHNVIPGRRYALDVRIPGDEKPVTAETTVPDSFEIVDVSADTLFYRAEEQYSVSLTRSSYPGRQSIYIQSVEALDPDVRSLTPLYLHRIYGINDPTEEDFASLDPSDLDAYLLVSSEPINEENYEVNPDGSLIVPLPWFGVAFYGDSRVSTTAVDDAIFDFVRFQHVQQGGSTLSPGEIPDVLDNIENGRGVFGGMARVESVVHVLRGE